MTALDYLTLSQVAALLPNRPHTACVWRWCRHGCLVRNGERVFLQHGRIGRSIVIKQSWLDAFLLELAGADMAAERFAAAGRTMKRPSVTARQRRTQDERWADEYLRAEGLMA